MLDPTISTYLTRRHHCKELTGVVDVHGHYQCANCKCVADGDCCQGEVATEPRPTVQEGL